MRVAFLLLAEQAFFRREDRSSAVDVDGAAFEHDTGAARLRADRFCMRGVRHETSNLLVEAPVGVFCPRVETELGSEWLWFPVLVYGQSPLVRPGNIRLSRS